MIHVDAHADVNPDMFGEHINHGASFRRAVEKSLLQGDKVWQIDLRGSGYSAEVFDWPREQGFTMVPAHEVWWQSLASLMARTKIGRLSVPQMPKIVRCYRGLNLVDCDLVEVSHVYDTSGNAALLGANLLLKKLCVAGRDLPLMFFKKLQTPL